MGKLQRWEEHQELKGMSISDDMLKSLSGKYTHVRESLLSF